MRCRINFVCDIPTYVSRHTRKVDVSLSSAENTKREVIVTERRPLERLFQKVLVKVRSIGRQGTCIQDLQMPNYRRNDKVRAVWQMLFPSRFQTLYPAGRSVPSTSRPPSVTLRVLRIYFVNGCPECFVKY